MRTHIFAIFILTVIVSFNTDVQAQSSVPQFKGYPVAEKPFTGKNAPVKMSRKDQIFRTRIREAAKEKPNYAGHYILAYWGCGMSCLTSVIIDAKTGKVYPTPVFISLGLDYSINFEPIDFRIDSKLIIFTGVRDEKEGDDGKHYYIFDRHRFVHLLSRISDLPKEDIPEDHSE